MREVLSTAALLVSYLLFLYPVLLPRVISLNVHSSSYQTQSPLGVTGYTVADARVMNAQSLITKLLTRKTFSELNFCTLTTTPLYLM